MNKPKFTLGKIEIEDMKDCTNAYIERIEELLTSNRHLMFENRRLKYKLKKALNKSEI